LTNKGPVSSREKRLDDRKKRTFHEQYPQPKKSRRVTQGGKDTSDSSNKAVLLDHNYCQRLPNNHKGTQMDFPFEDLEVLTSEIDTLKEENARLKAKLTNNKQLKRELFVDDVLKNDESNFTQGYLAWLA
jgi:FtsZ-binding cell division protein ZapB